MNNDVVCGFLQIPGEHFYDESVMFDEKYGDI